MLLRFLPWSSCGWVLDRQGCSKPGAPSLALRSLLPSHCQPGSLCSPEQANRGAPRAAPGQGRAALSLSPQILSEYDLVLVQEVRDADLSAVNDLMEQLNR